MVKTKSAGSLNANIILKLGYFLLYQVYPCKTNGISHKLDTVMLGWPIVYMYIIT